MDGQIVAEGASVEINQEWAEFLEPFTSIAGAMLAVFLVALVIVLAVWLGIAAGTHVGKTQAAKRIFGILTTAALAGSLVSMMGWTIASPEDGGAGLGSVSVSGGNPAGVEVDDHEPKQWSVDDVQGGSSSEDEEEADEPAATDEPTTEPPPTEEPSDGDGASKPEEGGCVETDAQQSLTGVVGSSLARPC
jgi:hypothetical protein